MQPSQDPTARNPVALFVGTQPTEAQLAKNNGAVIVKIEGDLVAPYINPTNMANHGYFHQRGPGLDYESVRELVSDPEWVARMMIRRIGEHGANQIIAEHPGVPIGTLSVDGIYMPATWVSTERVSYLAKQFPDARIVLVQ